MSRWRKAWITASVGLAASAAFVAMPPAQADTASLVVNYSCTGGVAGSGPVTLTARVQIPTSVRTGNMLKLGWTIEYTGTRRFMSPDYFPAGAQVSLVGNVKLSGAWNGVLEPRGSREQGALQPGTPLAGPEGLSSEAHMTQPGVIRFTPKELTVDFVPPAEERVVNNDAPGRIAYSGPWIHRKATPPEYGDHLRDVHVTRTQGAEASIEFMGTGFEYIGRRQGNAGRVQVIIDGDDSAPPVDSSKTETGEPTNATEGNTTLWRRDDLSYGQHTVTVRALDEGKPVHVDAFKLLTAEMIDPPTLHQAACVITNNPGSVEITVGSGSPSTPPPTTSTPTSTNTTTPTPTNTSTGGPSTPGTTPPNPHQPWPTDDRHVSVVPPGGTPSGTATATATATTTVTPTATNYRAQVAATPKGGVDTGEAPEPRNAGSYGLIAGGSLLLMGSATGGLLLRRRRADHAGGTNR